MASNQVQLLEPALISRWVQASRLLPQSSLIKILSYIRMWFKAYVMLEDKQSQFKAGEYIFEASMTPAEIMQKLIDGKSVIHSVTVPEGWLTAQIITQIEAETKLTGEIPKGIREGELLPETYHFLLGDTKASVIARMREDMQKTLDELWKTRPRKTCH